jgi:hypothetical protein
MHAPVREADVLRACLDALEALRILAFRVNVGVVKIQERFVRFGVVGMADIISFPRGVVLWIECKAAKGKQSEFQKSFETRVRAHGHRYLIARDAQDVINEIAFLERKKTTATPERPPQNKKVISDEQRLQP